MRTKAHKGVSAPCAPGSPGPSQLAGQEAQRKKSEKIQEVKAALKGLSGVPLGMCPTRQSTPLGPRDVDSRLPGGGLIRNALHDVRPLDPRDTPAAASFSLGLAARLIHGVSGQIVWIRGPQMVREWGLPHPAGLQAFGLCPSRLLLVHPRQTTQALWAMEEAVQAKGVALVMGDIETRKLDLTASRRIHLAAEKTGTPALLLHPANGLGVTAALTRWAVASAPSRAPDYAPQGVGAPRWHVSLERAKAGRPGAFDLEWDYATHHFRLAAPVADRPAATGFQAANDERIAAA